MRASPSGATTCIPYLRLNGTKNRAEQFRKQYDINVFGQLDVTTAVLAHMRPRRSGTIVMMCSRLSWWPVNPVRPAPSH